ncbi:SUMF1/EgtB/PvdO family nonheme iron enzyme [Parvibaculum sp.]|uniref:SUMF1/EgtB/PvdO family nonheme iron enzyme n=1 Tax=Parvibaculum sp. TaxID=2024848 RepID=UPI0034A09E60
MNMFTGRTRTVVLSVLAAALVAAAAVAVIWTRGGSNAARMAAAEPAQCLAPPAADDAAPRAGSPAGMVWVPPGTFTMGDTIYPEEGPLRQVSVEGFWIDRTEVTNRDFAAFVAATGYVTVAERPVDTALHPYLPPEMRKAGAVVFVMPNDVDGMGDISQWWQYVPGANWRHPGGPASSIEGRDDFPVTAVALEDARAYAQWKGHALPSEAEWEWAARAADPAAPPSHNRPKEANTWQGLFPIVNTADDGFVGVAPVGCFKPNALGLHDMLGNLWEWTADSYDGRRDANVIKGGSFLCAPNYCMRYRPGARQPQEIDLATTHLGFRTVLAAPGPAAAP